MRCWQIKKIRTAAQTKVSGIADKLRATAEHGRKERLYLFHRLVKLEAAEATRVESSIVAFQRAEDERPLADQTGSPLTSTPLTGVVGTLTWEDLGRYHHDTIQPLGTALNGARDKLLLLQDVVAGMQGWES